MRKIFVMVVVIGVVLIIALILLINSFRSKKPPTVQTSSVAIPTQIPFSSGSTNRQLKSNDTSLLTEAEQAKLKSIQLSLPVEDDDIAIAYSPLAEQFIIQQKSARADEVLARFLENNGLKEFFQTHPEYFHITKNNLNAEILNIEDPYTELPDDDDGIEITPTPYQSDDQTNKQVNTFKSLFNLALSGNILEGGNSNITSGTQTALPEEEEIPQNQSSSNLDQAARSSCYKFRMNKCGGSATETINETRPGVANNTYPVEMEVIEELFANPNSVGLRNRRWQMEAGQIHPKLIRFLNEFVKSNSIEKHVGMANGVGRCCARNGSTGKPATGCKLTPHRLGVAIDLSVVNNTKINGAKIDNPGYRKALDWIAAQRGSLRPDSVTMSDVFTGLYPSYFHPDKGHRDHLHVDFRRSLNCQ